MELVKAQNNKEVIKEIFTKFGIDENVCDEFFAKFQTLNDKWKNRLSVRSVGINDLDGLKEKDGYELSREFKEMLDEVLLKYDSEYQKFVKLYKENK